MLGYVVARVQKIKSITRAKAAFDHNTRVTKPEHQNVENEHLNRVFGHLTTEAALGDLREQIKGVQESQGRRIRHDAVLALEYVFSFSHDAELSEEGKTSFLADCLKHVRTLHGDGQILQAAVHRDESTEHIHIMVVPVQMTEKGPRLQANVFTSKPALKTLQDEAGRLGAPYQLARGIEGSTATHLDIKNWYKMLKVPEFDRVAIPKRTNPFESDDTYFPRILQAFKDAFMKPLQTLQKKIQQLEQRPTLHDLLIWKKRAEAAEKAVKENAAMMLKVAEFPPTDLAMWHKILRDSLGLDKPRIEKKPPTIEKKGIEDDGVPGF